MDALFTQLLRLRAIDYVIVDQNLQILEASATAAKFADAAQSLLPGEDCRWGFPELVGMEPQLADLLHGSIPQLEIPAIARCTGETIRLYLDLSATRLPEINGKPGLVIFLADVTDRMRLEQSLIQGALESKLLLSALQESEARYRSLVELSPEAIAVHNGRSFIYINPAGIQLLGATRASDLIGTPVLDIIDLGDRAIAHEALQTSPPLTQIHSAQMQAVRLDGQLIEVETTSSPITYQGDPAIQLILRDVTQRNAIERMKDEFISVVSHELRTPLTSIQGALSLLSPDLIDLNSPKGQQMVNIASAGVARLARLVDDILDLERLQSGQLSMSKQPCQLTDLITGTIELMEVMASQADVVLTASVEPGVIAVDEDRLTQVMTNLISNAIKFSPPGATVTVTATLAPLRPSPQLHSATGSAVCSALANLHLIVADQGRGIPAVKLETIFERFQQVDASDSRQKGGTGLGLAICRSIVQQHGGEIWAESQLGEGSQFHVTLPVEFEKTLADPH
jgi:PAS domain S-box-containing protein